MARRHEISDEGWARVAEFMPPAPPRGGGRWRSHRQVFNGLLWKLGTGAQWRDLPERYGPWQTVYGRFVRWRRDGTFDRILGRLQALDGEEVAGGEEGVGEGHGLDRPGDAGVQVKSRR